MVDCAAQSDIARVIEFVAVVYPGSAESGKLPRSFAHFVNKLAGRFGLEVISTIAFVNKNVRVDMLAGNAALG